MKDAFGHGSNPRSAVRQLNNADKQLFGATAEHRILKSDTAAAAELAKGNPKSAAASVHPAQNSDDVRVVNGQIYRKGPGGMFYGDMGEKRTPETARRRVGGTYGT